MRVIGVTGNSGSGKSYISSLLKENNGFLIDADKVGHTVLEKGMYAYNEVVDTFGKNILDENNNIDRKYLGSIVFNNKDMLNKLNQITHKYITKIIMEKIDEVKLSSLYKFIILDAALLIEVGLHKVCNEVILVYADRDIRIKRIMKRDKISKHQAKNRIDSQTPFEYLEKYAHTVILNNENNKLTKEDILSLLADNNKQDI